MLFATSLLATFCHIREPVELESCTRFITMLNGMRKEIPAGLMTNSIIDHISPKCQTLGPK